MITGRITYGLGQVFNPTPAEASLLQQIAARESSGNYLAKISPATCLQLTGRTDCTASGAYQFTNATWGDATQATGVGLDCPTASSCSPDAQDINALWLLRARGTSPWSSSGPYTPIIDGGASTPIVDVSGGAAATPTSSIMDQLQTAAASAGVDLTSPVTDALIIGGVGLAALFLLRT